MAYVFFVGAGIGICLILAAAVIFCATGFKRLTMRDIEIYAKSKDRAGTYASQKWRKLVLQQDKVVSTLFIAYLFLVIAASTAMAHYWLTNMPLLTVIVHIVCVTVFIVLVTYLLPKSYALKKDSGFILQVEILFHMIYALFVLPVWAMTALGNNIAAIMPKYFQSMTHAITAKQEMNFIVRYRGMLAAQDKEALEKARAQRRMATLLDEFMKKTVADVMIPMADIPMVDGEQAMETLVEYILNSTSPRMLVYQENPEHLIGVLHVDLFLKALALAEGDLNAVDFVSAVSEPLIIGPQTGVTDQINMFRQTKQGFALVRDVRGAWLGGVSLDQLLEQTVTLLHDKQDAQPSSRSENQAQDHDA